MSAKLINAVGVAAQLFSHWLHFTTAKRSRSATVQSRPCQAGFTRASGLSKTQAEELLDCLEAHGVHDCQTSYRPEDGFTVFRKSQLCVKSFSQRLSQREGKVFFRYG